MAHFAVFVSSVCMLLRLILLAKLVMMGGLMMMMGGSVMISGGLMMMFDSRMLRRLRHVVFPEPVRESAGTFHIRPDRVVTSLLPFRFRGDAIWPA